ncbi:hypothetical protein Esti_000868 [Eimeria stiedai]
MRAIRSSSSSSSSSSEASRVASVLPEELQALKDAVAAAANGSDRQQGRGESVGAAAACCVPPRPEVRLCGCRSSKSNSSSSSNKVRRRNRRRWRELRWRQQQNNKRTTIDISPTTRAAARAVATAVATAATAAPIAGKAAKAAAAAAVTTGTRGAASTASTAAAAEDVSFCWCEGPVSHCCFVPQQHRSSSTKAAAEAEGADADQEEQNAEEAGEPQEESSALEAALSSSSKSQQQQQQLLLQQRITSSCLLAEGTRVFLGSCRDTAEPQRFFSAKSPVTALAARSDGALCTVGEASGQLSVVTVDSRKPLRRLHHGSSTALRTCCFGGSKHSLFAAGDDCVVREWSLEMGVVSAELDGHSDSIRCLCCLPSFPFVAASASYDSSAKLWDTRTRKACLTLPQGDPTECVRLWDVRQPRVAACSLENFAKTVTVVREFPAAAAAGGAAAADEGSAGLLLATASLDNVVRIFSLDTLQLLQCFRVRSDLLCMDVAVGSSKSSSSKRSSTARSSCCRLVLGLSDGGWIVRQAEAAPPVNEEFLLQQQQQQQQRKRLLLLKPTDGGYFKRGRTAPSNPGDVVFDSLQSRRLSRLDRLIKSFQYQAALDVALATTPEHVIALTSELLQRGALHAAVRGRDPSSSLPLLRFAAKHSAFRAPSETAVVLQLLLALLQESECWILEKPQEADEVKSLLKKVAQRVAFELEQIHRLASIEAMVDALLAV